VDSRRKRVQAIEIKYLSPREWGDPPPPYRTGEAGYVWLGPSGDLHTDTRVALSANATHALLGHGVVDALNALPLDGRLGQGLEVMVPPASLEDARSLFYEADRKTYGARYEFMVASSEHDDRSASPGCVVEYRIRIDNREYQRTLTRLTYLMTMGSREGRGVWLRL
jgi:hypothetical protein